MIPVALCFKSRGLVFYEYAKDGGKMMDSEACSRPHPWVLSDWLNQNEYQIRHTFVLWCQGESDGDAGTEKETYLQGFDRMLNAMLLAGVERLFLVRIGHCNVEGSLNRYAPMMEWQEEIAQSNERVTMVSRLFSTMRERGMMKDAFHYYQAAYNEVGTEAGENAAAWVRQYAEQNEKTD